MTQTSPTFDAKYLGQCPCCYEMIEPGDQVCYNEDDFVVHEDCA